MSSVPGIRLEPPTSGQLLSAILEAQRETTYLLGILVNQQAAATLALLEALGSTTDETPQERFSRWATVCGLSTTSKPKPPPPPAS